MEVSAIADGAGVAVIDEMTAEEQRTFVTGTERLQTLENLVHLPVHIAQFHLRLYVQGRHLLSRSDMSSNVFLEPALELRQVLEMHTQSGGELMAAEIGKQISAGVDCRVYIKIGYRTRTSADDIIVTGSKDYRRPVIGLREPAGSNADYPFMPLGREDNGSIFCRIHRVFLELRKGFVGRLGIIITAVLVIGIDLLGEPQSSLCVMTDEQPHRLRAALDTSGGIDTRTDLIDQVADGDGLTLYTRYLHDCADALGRHRVQRTQAVERQNTVLARHGHYIRSDRHRQERQEPIDLLHVHAATHRVRLRQLETHAAAAQFLKRIEAVGAFHIQYRYGIRDGVARSMMVTDDKIHTDGASIRHLLHRLDAAIQGNDERAALFLGSINTFVDAGLQLFTALIGAMPQIVTTITAAIPQIIGSITQVLLDNLPLIISTGVELFTSLVGALPEIINGIVEVLPEIIDAVVNTLTDSIDILVDAGLTLFLSLVDALPEIIDGIVAVLPDVIEAVIGVEAGVKLFVALVENLPEIIAGLVGALPEILDAVLSGIGDFISSFADMGWQLMMGLADGIAGSVGDLINKAVDALGGVVDSIKEFFGIASPSKLFEEFGGYLDMGLAIGIEGDADLPVDAMDALSGELSSAVDLDAEVQRTYAYEPAEYGDNLTIPVYIGGEELDTLVVNAKNRDDYRSGGH